MPSGDGKPPQVFLSHAESDKERFVLPLARKLRENGVDAWVDRWEILPGDSLVKRIFDEGIGKSDVILVVLSHHSTGSRWMREELNQAMVRRINGLSRLIPVRLDRVDSPPGLSDSAWIDIDLDRDRDLVFALDRILRAIFQVHDRPALGPSPDFARPFGQLKALLSGGGARHIVNRLVREAADNAIRRFVDLVPLIDVPDNAIPAMIENWLAACDDTFSELVKMVAAGVNHGDPVQDDVWVETLDHVLDAVSQPYPALLLSYAIGVAATARRRDELVYAALNGAGRPALHALKVY